jgi:hypothetical protein
MPPFITVRSATSDIPDGVYRLRLVAISDPKTVTIRYGERAGQNMELIDWTWVIASGPHKDKEIQSSTSLATSPRSKMFSYLTAFDGGRKPQSGTDFEKADLIGRLVSGTIQVDDNGWPQITNIGAIPADDLGEELAAATGVSTRPPTSGSVPVAGAVNREEVAFAKAGDDLPF